MNKTKQNIIDTRGFSLIEFMIAVSLFAVIAGAIIGIIFGNYGTNVKTSNILSAMRYAEEGLEASRSIRDSNFLSLQNGEYGLTTDGNMWTLGETPETLENMFERSLTIESVYRDAENNISTTGEEDVDGKKITATIRWVEQNENRVFQLSTYLTNYRGKDIIDTLLPEFALGVFDKTTVNPAQEPPLLNGTLVLTASALEAEGIGTVNINGQGVDVAVQGDYAFSVVNRANNSFVVTDVSDPANAFTVTVLDIDKKGKALALKGNYAFVASDVPSHGLVVVDISNPPNPAVVANLNLDNNSANGIMIHENTAYITTTNSNRGLYAVNIENPLNPASQGFRNIYGTGNHMTIQDEYLYVGVNNNTKGLAVLDITNPNAPVYKTSLNISGSGYALDSVSNYVFISIQSGSTGGLSVVNIMDPEAPFLVKFIATAFHLRGIAVHEKYIFAAGDHPQNGLAIFDIGYPPLTYLIGFLNIGARGMSVFSFDDLVFVSTDTANNGLAILAGGNLSIDRFQTAGTFESQVFDTGSDETVYKGLYWDEFLSPTGDIKIKIRTSSTLENITTAQWVGVDGTLNTYYEEPRSPISISGSASGTRYIQYKAFLSGDSYSTPEIREIKINYE